MRLDSISAVTYVQRHYAIRDTAWKAQLRLCGRYRHLIAAGKAKVVVTTAIAREMVGFIWAIAQPPLPT